MPRKNPWLTDAAAGATGQTFEIRTVADFFKVPEERRRICLREFHSWLAIQKGVVDLIMAAAPKVDDGLSPDDFRFHTDVFRWIDDGRATISVEIATTPPTHDEAQSG